MTHATENTQVNTTEGVSSPDAPVQTVMIYDCMGEEPIRFAVLNGDYRHFDRCYVNSSDGSGDALSDFLYPDGSSDISVALQDNFPHEAVAAGAHVIVAGFLP